MLQPFVSVKILNIIVEAYGCDDPGLNGNCSVGQAVLKVNGIDHSQKQRGYNVVVVNAADGKKLSYSCYLQYERWWCVGYANTSQRRVILCQTQLLQGYCNVLMKGIQVK